LTCLHDSVQGISEQLSDTETEQGRARFDELEATHGVIRRDLNTVQRQAEAVLAGLDPLDVQRELGRMETTGPLWHLKVNCLRWCRFVQDHIDAEDRERLPALRQADPSLGPAVDRLTEEHRAISNHLEEVSAAADALTESDDEAARRRVVDALNALTDDLLEHLAHEELSVGPVLRRMRFE